LSGPDSGEQARAEAFKSILIKDAGGTNMAPGLREALKQVKPETG